MAHSTPKATFNDDFHRYDFPDEAVTFLVDRFEHGRDGAIKCEVEISGLGGEILPPTTTNLLAEVTRTAIYRSLVERTPKEVDLDWRAMLNTVATNSVQRYRSGTPPVDLKTISGWRERPRYLLHPFIQTQGDTILFADGGAGKSTVAEILGTMTATGVPILPECNIYATGNVLTLDWEADEETWAERLHALCAAYDPPLEIPDGGMIYKRMYAPLHESAQDLRKLVAQHNVILVIIDSLGRARGGGVEDSESTIRMFAAIRRLNVPTLCIDHLSKEGVFTERGGTRPIGSIYTHNNARLTWSLTAADSHLDDSLSDGFHSIQLVNHKNNNGRLMGRRTYSLRYYNDDFDRLTGIYIDPLDPTTVPDFLRLLPLFKRCAAMIAEHGAATTEELATWLDAKKSEIERALAGQPGRFWLDREAGRWQLVEAQANVSQTGLFDGNEEVSGQW